MEFGAGLTPHTRCQAAEGLDPLGKVVSHEKGVDVRCKLGVCIVVVTLNGRLLEGSVICSTWSLVQKWFGLVSLCSIPFAWQSMSNMGVRLRAVGPRRFVGQISERDAIADWE